MKTRKFKNIALQAMYNLYRHEKRTVSQNFWSGSASAGAYKAGLAGHRSPGVPTSLAHSAWAAGADERRDLENA